MTLKYSTKRILQLWLLVVAATTIVGCGSSGDLPTYRAGGKVVFPDGTPLGSGCLECEALEATRPVSARGNIQPDGTFQLGTFKANDGAVEGEHRVLVSVPQPELGPMLPGTLSKTPPTIDLRFRRFETSGLKLKVTQDAAKNQFVIRVERPKK